MPCLIFVLPFLLLIYFPPSVAFFWAKNKGPLRDPKDYPSKLNIGCFALIILQFIWIFLVAAFSNGMQYSDSHLNYASVCMIIILLVVVYISFLCGKFVGKENESITIMNMKKYVIPKMVEHYAVLNRKYNSAKFVDEYGLEKFNYDRFDKDLKYFAENILNNRTLSAGFLFECFIEAGRFVETDDFDLSEIETGEDYERFVREICVSAGFECGMTPKTGDQGADLIVRKGRINIAIQCKYYSRPVGNSAVQEVIAGQKFYNCDYACVVSNQDYTDSAKELARSADVELLSHETLIPYLKRL